MKKSWTEGISDQEHWARHFQAQRRGSALMRTCCRLEILPKEANTIGAAISAFSDVAERSGYEICWPGQPRGEWSGAELGPSREVLQLKSASQLL
jgi:hypothetical protein